MNRKIAKTLKYLGIFLCASALVLSVVIPLSLFISCSSNTQPKPLWNHGHTPFDIISNPDKDNNKIGNPKDIDVYEQNIKLSNINDYSYRTINRYHEPSNVLLLNLKNNNEQTNAVVNITPSWFNDFSISECEQIKYINVQCDNNILLNLKENAFNKFQNIEGFGVFNDYDEVSFKDERYSLNKIDIENNAIPKTVTSLAFEQELIPIIKTDNQEKYVGLFSSFDQLVNFTCYVNFKHLWLDQNGKLFDSFFPFNKEKSIVDYLPKEPPPNMTKDEYAAIVFYWSFCNYYQAKHILLPKLFFKDTKNLLILNIYGYSNYLVNEDIEYVNLIPKQLEGSKKILLFTDFNYNTFDNSSVLYKTIQGFRNNFFDEIEWAYWLSTINKLMFEELNQNTIHH